MLERFETSTEKAFFLGLCATFVLAVVAAIASVRTQIGVASPGFVVWQNLIVPAIGAIGPSPEAAAVPQRTVVTAVDGDPVHDATQLRERVRARPAGSWLAYTFRRDGRDGAARVPSSVLRWRDVAPVYLPYLLEGMALLVTAVVIFLFRPRDPGARAGVALGTVAGLLQILALDLFSAAWLQRLYFVVESLVPAVLLHFALCFPEEKAVVRRHRWLKWAAYAACAPFAILQNWFLTRDPERHLLVNDWVYVTAALAGVVSMAALVHGLVTARSALARQQLKIVLAGMAAAVFVPALGLFAIILLGIAAPMNVLTPFFLLFPLSIAYAVGRHDLFRVDRYLRLGVAWAVLTVVVFASYAAVALAGQAWLGAGTRAPALLVPLYVLAMLLVANPVRARVQAIVDRLFHRQGYSYRAAVEATSRALAAVLDTDRIAAAVLGTLTDEMAAEWAVLAVLGEASEPPRHLRPAAGARRRRGPRARRRRDDRAARAVDAVECRGAADGAVRRLRASRGGARLSAAFRGARDRVAARRRQALGGVLHGGGPRSRADARQPERARAGQRAGRGGDSPHAGRAGRSRASGGGWRAGLRGRARHSQSPRGHPRIGRGGARRPGRARR